MLVRISDALMGFEAIMAKHAAFYISNGPTRCNWMQFILFYF
jgi:hypothetical protein